MLRVFCWAFLLDHALAFVVGNNQTPTRMRTKNDQDIVNSPFTCRSSTRLHVMKVTIRIVGRKPGSSDGSAWLDQGVSLYQQRLERHIALRTEWHKTNDALVKGIQGDADKKHKIVILDPTIGTQYTSEAFADHFYKWMQDGGSRVVFVIGGAEGLPSQILEAAYLKMSLSKLTFTHQFARLLLVEQVYRAYEINRGSDYHK
ncbi:hypothetical protein MPSEU_000851000 [Mayamaea pseudoterrestris]|nr:hypothetical protein MPSEU_000851000 [Mayamaea pseudoterrestris]